MKTEEKHQVLQNGSEKNNNRNKKNYLELCECIDSKW